ncbi:MAG: CZB domain-containing protein [Candidatus Omnitrophica bacterium]|nr:CZB domain-containing protein [Candidatus Omnitrophota bacterium]MBU1924384.1 CZB domain-containing protein [Candidatus Omnitrophota bacterium]
MSKIEFSMVRMMQRTWRMKIRSFLQGQDSLPEQEAYSFRDCEFGKWLYSEGMAKYGKIPEMKEIEKIHIHLHHNVKKNKHIREKKLFFEAEKSLQKIEELAQEMMYLLNIVEKKSSEEIE